MAKIFKDFIYKNKKLSDLNQKYISAQLDNSDEISLSLERNMEIGETNPYKIEGNYFGDTWTDTLPLTIHLIKNPCLYTSQKDRELNQSDIREITRWLTSNHYPEWLEFEYETSNTTDAKFYKGWFNNIETFVVGNRVYGLIIYFKCTTPFAYTDKITKQFSSTTYSNHLIFNNNDELEDYIHPTIRIHPKSNGHIALCNLSDCHILEEGVLIGTGSGATYFDALLDKCDIYAKSKGCNLKYTGNGTFNIVPLCNDTAVQFYLIDKYNSREQKCTAFFNPMDKNYKIIEDGFVFMQANTNLDIYMDCQQLSITDSLNRMITYDKLGILEVDHMYWFRLLNGNNNILLYGNADFTFEYRESRKVGEL